MNALLAPLVESPQMNLLIDELKQISETERVQREQFYEDVSPQDKWEFINGEVVMHSPATIKHNLVRARIERLIFEHIDGRNMGQVHGEKILVAFTRNDYEPDVLYFPQSIAETLKPDQWKCPVPDLIVEVLSPSSRRLDRVTKYDDYAAHRVSEYWIVDPEEETIEQYLGNEGVYRLSVKLTEGRFSCRAIPGFIMTVRAAFDDQVNREVRREIRESNN